MATAPAPGAGNGHVKPLTELPVAQAAFGAAHACLGAGLSAKVTSTALDGTQDILSDLDVPGASEAKALLREVGRADLANRLGKYSKVRNGVAQRNVRLQSDIEATMKDTNLAEQEMKLSEMWRPVLRQTAKLQEVKIQKHEQEIAALAELTEKGRLQGAQIQKYQQEFTTERDETDSFKLTVKEYEKEIVALEELKEVARSQEDNIQKYQHEVKALGIVIDLAMQASSECKDMLGLALELIQRASEAVALGPRDRARRLA
ncbi:unnamed protein product [Prorocentrum cordatum]|uniref:Uncharacterized protein n=1 Tax=Prorocentrum cordatum TaxID=2364126 RepID=A0ABN9TMA2_9DINO|nr:unnamed protein product [Polarella glacialis]